jgi:hypothetical protein
MKYDLLGHTCPPFCKYEWFSRPLPDPQRTMKHRYTYTCSKNVGYIGLQLQQPFRYEVTLILQQQGKQTTCTSWLST